MNKIGQILSYASAITGVVVAIVALLISSRLPARTVYTIGIGGLMGGVAVVFLTRRFINRSNKNPPDIGDK